MESSRVPVPNRLKRYRRVAGLSQKKAAKLIGLSNTSSLCKWEKGKALPSVPYLFKLSVIYHTHPVHLYQDLWQSLKKDMDINHHNLFGQNEFISHS
jgi:DNA-binding XRE family transcriptional regulator